MRPKAKTTSWKGECAATITVNIACNGMIIQRHYIQQSIDDTHLYTFNYIEQRNYIVVKQKAKQLYHRKTKTIITYMKKQKAKQC